jgi:GT2 family glycosyltransferase
VAIPVLIVPTLYHYDLLQNMLNSVDWPVDHVVVIDNGGELEACECSNAQQISIVSLPSNLGVAGAWNLGIKLTPFAPWWLICNDDIQWVPGKLEKFEQYIAPRTIVADWRPLTAFCGFAISEQVIQDVGLFDEYYYPGCGEEVNYWTRAQKQGIQAIDIPDAYELQGAAGRTRQALQEKYPRTSGITSANLAEGVASRGYARGWDLEKRRVSDPTTRYKLPPIVGMTPGVNPDSR